LAPHRGGPSKSDDARWPPVKKRKGISCGGGGMQIIQNTKPKLGSERKKKTKNWCNHPGALKKYLQNKKHQLSFFQGKKGGHSKI